MSHNYALNSNKPAFSVADDDMESAFLGSSSKPYTGGYGQDSQNISAASEYHSTIQQLQDVERRTLESTKRSLQAIAESEQIGVETAKDLVHQREQLVNTNKRLENIDEDLKESQKNIKAIKSVFNSFRQWMTTPKNGATKKDTNKEAAVRSPVEGYKEPNFDHNPVLEKAVNIAPPSQDPSLKLRGVDYSESSGSSRRFDPSASNPFDEWRETTKKVNAQLDDDLDEMSFGLARLKGLAEGLNQELEGQNKLLDDINVKADKTGFKLSSTNQQVNALLKK